MGFSGTFPFLHPVPGMRRLREVITDTERAQEPALDARAQPLTTVVGPVAAGLGAWSGSQLMFESLPDPLLLLVPEKSPSGTSINVVCVWANAPACALHGRTQQGMLGTRLLDVQPSTGLFTPGLLVMETGQAVVIEGLDGSGHGGSPQAPCRDPPVSRQRASLLPLVAGQPWEGDSATVPAVAERRYRLLTRHASDGVVEVDSDHPIVWVSESIEARLGWTAAALLGKPAIAFVHRNERGRALRAGLGRSCQGSFQGDLRILCADGRWRLGAVLP